MPSRPPPPPPGDPLIGRRLGDRYILRALIDRGGFGAVYRAEQPAVGRTVAVKVIHPERQADDEARRRFVREAAAMAAVSHPCVASLYDHGIEPDGLMYLALEYIEGRSLKAVLAEAGRLSPTRAVHLIRQVVAGVAEAHRFGVIHRDLKPGNIMVTRDALGIERVRVLDFGIARRIDDDSGGVTRQGIIVGTPRYASPEQIRAHGIGPWSDQYAIGVVLFCLLAGHPPFTASNVAELLVQQLRATPPRLASPVPSGLADIVDRCLAKQPAGRFRDLGALSRALDAIDGIPCPALPLTEIIRPPDATLRTPPPDAMAKTADPLPTPADALSPVSGPMPTRPTPPLPCWDGGQVSAIAGAVEEPPSQSTPGATRGAVGLGLLVLTSAAAMLLTLHRTPPADIQRDATPTGWTSAASAATGPTPPVRDDASFWDGAVILTSADAAVPAADATADAGLPPDTAAGRGLADIEATPDFVVADPGTADTTPADAIRESGRPPAQRSAPKPRRAPVRATPVQHPSETPSPVAGPSLRLDWLDTRPTLEAP